MDSFGITAASCEWYMKWNSPAEYTAVLFAMSYRHSGTQYSYCGQKNSHGNAKFQKQNKPYVCEREA